jgi:lysophospholipase L1-like esterase
MTRRFLFALAALLLLGTFAVSAADVATTSAPAAIRAVRSRVIDQPSPRADKAGAPDPEWIARHDAYVAQAKQGGVDLYFVGDSITDRWHTAGNAVWTREFAGWNAGNFGIGGDGCQHVLWRLKNGELDGVSPKAFVVMIGTNNIGYSTNPQIVAANAAIVKEIASRFPQAKILLLGIFPRQDTNIEYHTQIPEINAALAKLDDGKNIRFMDIGKKFLAADGKPPNDIMPDGVHPGEKGYQIWADAIKPVLTEWLGPPKK